MIEPVTMYKLKCNSCGKYLWGDNYAWERLEVLKERAQEAGWFQLDATSHTWLCTSCHEEEVEEMPMFLTDINEKVWALERQVAYWKEQCDKAGKSKSTEEFDALNKQIKYWKDKYEDTLIFGRVSDITKSN